MSKNLTPDLMDSVDDILIDLIDTLESIDEHQKLAELNETSISNNNGGRIIL